MRIIHEGVAFDVKDVQFDLIGQRYSLWVKQYKFLNFWRRENGRVGVEVKDAWIYINTSTPHIAKLVADGKNTEEICAEIKLNARSYIDYASNNKNKNWVTFTINEPVMFMDKVEMQDALDEFGIKVEDRDAITLFKAY